MPKIFKKKIYQSGMTLIEMIVVLSIFMIISTMVMFNYGKFNSSLSMQNLADDIALTVREAQSYAIGARGLPNNMGFFNGYGIHLTTASLDLSKTNKGSKKSFIFFADFATNNVTNKMYDFQSGNTCGTITSGNECFKIISIASADSISGIYLGDNTDPIPEAGSIDIVFTRPYPEASFCYKESSTSSCSSTTISSVRIKVSNPRTDTTKEITVSNTGQISVK